MKNGGGCKEKDTSGRRVEIKRNVTKIWPVYLHVIQRWVRDQKTLTPCVPQTSYYTSKTSEVEHESHLDQVVHCLPPRSQYLRPFIDATTTIFNIRSTYCCWFSSCILAWHWRRCDYYQTHILQGGSLKRYTDMEERLGGVWHQYLWPDI